MLDLSFRYVVLIVQCSYLFLHLALPYQQPLNIALELIQVIIDLSLHNGLRFTESFDIMIFMLTMDDTLRADTLALTIETEV